MRPPLLDVGRDRVDDLALEVEAEVVARCKVREPLVADPDHPAVDLLDHGVRHRVRALEFGEVVAGRQPLVDPGGRRQRCRGAGRDARSHEPHIDPPGVDL